MISIIFFNSSLLKSVEIKTSCAVLPFLAIALYPLMVFTDNLIINFEDLPLTLDIAIEKVKIAANAAHPI